ncbi:MAG: GAF domain-containing sensor histidine kinase [Deltaproteobacteria bacterium]|nr:GAF domain-containing sensor histidine kinase [Deltaproteobacteria bacterium]NNC74531.1 GAF domain-containing sensor histidine kinase [Acidimicrobiia bacterium]
MPAADLPVNEEERLADVRALDILDSLPEATYDAITYLASQICDAPIALISVIDEERQWLKSKIGIDVVETERDVAFCAHGILEPDSMLIVPDATKDPRFADNPLVVDDPSIRFYAGAPLRTPSGHALGMLCVIDRVPRELTEAQQETMKALAIQVNALLELRRTVDELQRTQERLEESMQERETFLATVSHEIKTPLTAVIGFIQILTEEDSAVSEDERAETLSTIAREAGDVSNLIEDLLVAARSETGSLRVNKVDVSLPAQAAQVLEGADPAKVSRVEVEFKPCRASGDPARVRQIVRNLLTNAFRYGGPDLIVRTFPEGDGCHLQVVDNGEGIPEAERDRVFERFGQATGGRTASGSTGLGLPISRLLAEAMGGSLSYSFTDEGSVFDLELPATV